MLLDETEKLYKSFIDLTKANLAHQTSNTSHHLIQNYVEQNLLILNDILSLSINNLKKLQTAKTSNDIICMQAKFTSDITKNLAQSTQRFLNAALGQIADYNDWLKTNCPVEID